MRWRPSYCHQCGRPDEQVGRISKRGLCRFCGAENMELAGKQLNEKRGPVYNLYAVRQAEGYRRHVERQLARLDELAREQEQTRRP